MLLLAAQTICSIHVFSTLRIRIKCAETVGSEEAIGSTNHRPRRPTGVVILDLAIVCAAMLSHTAQVMSCILFVVSCFTRQADLHGGTQDMCLEGVIKCAEAAGGDLGYSFRASVCLTARIVLFGPCGLLCRL